MAVGGRWERIVDWWVRLPLGIKVVALILAWQPTLACLPVALFGSTHQYQAANLGAIGGVLGIWSHGRDYWELDGASRVVVSRVVRTGVPSGSADLDDIAAGRFHRALGLSRTALAIEVILGCVLLTIPVVAAIRVDVWWLVTLVPQALVAVPYLVFKPRLTEWETFQQHIAAANHRG